jgi:hypothetical protein
MTRPLEHTEEGRPVRRVLGNVDSSTRVIVAFPFSMVRMDDARGAAEVAELLARICRAAADGGTEELRALGGEADELAARLRRR